ncbi:MAG: hypothetical protein ACYS9X_32040 [Planctomycetota bacterium]|jgi:hypothetical protein
MGEPLEELAKVEGLPPKAAILARALLRNSLAPADRVLAAAREVAADAGESPGGILEKLIAAGDLAEDRAKQIEAALEKRLAERKRATPLLGGKGTKPKSSRVWRPKRERVRPVTPPDQHGPDEGEVIDRFIEEFVRSRLHQLILEVLARPRSGCVADPKKLAMQFGCKEKEIERILKDWKSKGMLSTAGTYPYYYDPPARMAEHIALFMKAWRRQATHGRLLARILELEGK